MGIRDVVVVGVEETAYRILVGILKTKEPFGNLCVRQHGGRLRLKCDGTCAETRFRLPAFEM